MRYLEDQKTCIQQLQQETISDNMTFRMFAEIWDLPRTVDEIDENCSDKLKMVWTDKVIKYSKYLESHGNK